MEIWYIFSTEKVAGNRHQPLIYEGFDEKVTVNGSSQYKVHNSNGKTYYVTENEAYVYVK